ncbi:response regulator transcription factor [Nocardioides carbamazepini]|uniref:response regulator transcription factor n=1 Tax=Nocardioides carbamazepini TaxID=2854259 RepID=UPI00214A1674|nr:response regulator transcription factor [Nocardioides carbamazepini]MCR1783966.1 response regulator transcription factor [Nocardioides carbamazepini]
MARILVVDDHLPVREVVSSYLRARGHDVVESGDGQDALSVVRAGGVDAVVLDVMLPGLDGREVCRRLRAIGDIPIIMLTALGREADRVHGLELGADDYVGKPFSPRELALRVDSVLRRTTGRTDEPDVLSDGDLVVDVARHAASRAGAELSLTLREFELLRFLVSHAGTAYSREQLLQQVWGWSVGDQSTVTVHVRRLREKVEPDPRRPVRLVTVWGVGYRWDPAAEAAS